ncbi:MAG: hypothetical protein IPK65_01200 [Gammaproteobacteria bacterium]|nr:hypothetical protein [Gammaproteobacteria bacterium]
MNEVVTFLNQWQTLLGAVITAAAAFAVAFLVSHIDRRRENLAAAMVITSDLTTVVGAERVLNEIADHEGIADEHLAIWTAQRLTSLRPRLSPLFDGYIARLMLVDVKLSAYLELFKVVYRDVEYKLERLEADIQHYNVNDRFPRPEEDVRRDLDLVGTGFRRAAGYARCAERLLNILVLSNWPSLHRLRRTLYRTKVEKDCEKILKSGAL